MIELVCSQFLRLLLRSLRLLPLVLASSLFLSSSSVSCFSVACYVSRRPSALSLSRCSVRLRRKPFGGG